MSVESRRAPAAFAESGADGAVLRSGEADAVVEDDALAVGPLSVALVDVDGFRAADHRIDLELWPHGRLSLTGLGRRFDAFSEELRRARNRARVAGLLAHGVEAPEVFTGAVLDGSGWRATELQLYDTHLTLVPEYADPRQLPLGALSALTAPDEPPAVVLETREARTVVGLLGRHRDAFRRALAKRVDGQARLLEALTGERCFSDGLGVERERTLDFPDLLARFTSPQRSACAAALLTQATGAARFGFVRLLDPDGESLAAPGGLPLHWASFLLVAAGGRTALEILAGPSAATYVFAGGIEEVNRDLQALHFRRAPLALTESEARVTPANPHRLALRRLEPLMRLRDRTVARLVHGDGWEAGACSALSGSQ